MNHNTFHPNTSLTRLPQTHKKRTSQTMGPWLNGFGTVLDPDGDTDWEEMYRGALPRGYKPSKDRLAHFSREDLLPHQITAVLTALSAKAFKSMYPAVCEGWVDAVQSEMICELRAAHPHRNEHVGDCVNYRLALANLPSRHIVALKVGLALGRGD